MYCGATLAATLPAAPIAQQDPTASRMPLLSVLARVVEYIAPVHHCLHGHDVATTAHAQKCNAQK
eukprot:11187601-Lingulodinium_polyedra.AAC.1